jgi:nucleoside-diphosphate-sugar epimerase
VVDDQPATFREFHRDIATTSGAPAPLVLPASLIRLLAPYGGAVMSAVSMRVSNARARTDLHWSPKYPSYRYALAGER